MSRRRQIAIALSYPSSSYTRANLEKLYREHCEKVGKLFSERGFETRWVAYKGLVRSIRRRKGAIRTTNGQRARQLEKDGRARSTRTVRRVHRELQAMGVIITKHVVKSGPARRPGQLDCIAIALCPVRGQSFVRPPLQGSRPPCLLPPKPSVPPPTAAENEHHQRGSPPIANPPITVSSDQKGAGKGEGFIHPWYRKNPGMIRFSGDLSRPPRGYERYESRANG